MDYKSNQKPNIDKRRDINNDFNASLVTAKIIIFYLFIGFTWILTSDYFVNLFFDDIEVINQIQSIKGASYVVITALIFYIIIHKSIKMYEVTINDLKKAYMGLDLSHQKTLELDDKLFKLAYYDLLTDLPNKVLLEKTVSKYIEDHPDDGMIGFIYFDIDEFSHINEVKGHSIGDLLLKKIAELLSSKINAPHMLARMGGDEFVLALFGLNQLETYIPQVESYINLIRTTFVLDDDDFFVTYSVGVALYPDNGKDYITLLRHADAAQSVAKAKGKDQIVIFDDEMVTMIKQQTELLNYLRHAITNNEFSLHYQPIINLKNDQTIGVEALIRWQHPVKGFIPPLEFISISEKNGYIKEISEWVFKEVAHQYEAWNIEGKAFRISINISPIMLMYDRFIPYMNEWIQTYHLDSSQITLEITESAIIEDIQKSVHVLKQLKKLGFIIALDDFGTGYSSLTYLQKLPIDIIKIDRTFISNIKPNTEEFHVLRYMIELAHHLNLIVVAEGIETVEQANMVKKYDVDLAQGYFFCRPMPQQRIIEYLKETDSN
ncbi:MAG: bifunctional diguanylate cyclase/phosphodiesterase [Acholeplasmataceae bacterium]|nr:bifunctional diguanylate cyclase/phosphodiesterase [Acholeplasmataceae bacterium]